MAEKNTKYVTKEYHEGQIAYEQGKALTSNPYLPGEVEGSIFYWAFGWQDAMAEDVRWLKALVHSAADMAEAEKKRTH